MNIYTKVVPVVRVSASLILTYLVRLLPDENIYLNIANLGYNHWLRFKRLSLWYCLTLNDKSLIINNTHSVKKLKMWQLNFFLLCAYYFPFYLDYFCLSLSIPSFFLSPVAAAIAANTPSPKNIETTYFPINVCIPM